MTVPRDTRVQVVGTTLAPLWIVTNRAFDTEPSKALVVLIEGDGTPWLRRYWVSPDPTSTNPLLLPLLPEIPVPALYLGRPCYFQSDIRQQGHDLGHCAPEFWTGARYSEAVVQAMEQGLVQLAGSHRQLMLVGHSGGGTLATLLAARLADRYRIELLTFAGNLDVASWVAYHRYSPLLESLDPKQQAPLPASIYQEHWAGGRDDVIHAAWVRGYAAQQADAHYHFQADFDHQCCWKALALSRIRARLQSLPAN